MNISKLVAVVFSVFVMTLPMASATQVNILFNGLPQDKVIISPKNLVNKQLSIIHEPSDITWSRVKVLVTVNSASLAHSIEKIFLYKCKLLNPVACTNVEPIKFETFADTELLWKDISRKGGPGTYPQTANIMTLVKLKGPSGQTNWVAFWDKITRTKFNVFTKFNFDLDQVDFHTSSSDLVLPTRKFIENFQMLPFNWAEKVVFKSSPLFAVGGDEQELEKPTLTSANPPGNTVSNINKDFFFVSAQSSSGITNFVTLNKNPSFSCGDNKCESNLGETENNCCYDCGCSLGSFCDIATSSEPKGGACQLEKDISLQVINPNIPEVTDCSNPISFDLNVRIKNAPASVPDKISGIVTLDGTPHSVSCTQEAGIYKCPLQVQPTISCGAGSLSLRNNEMNTTITFNDGSTQKNLDLSSKFSDINVKFNCGCPNGYFCDSKKLTCSPEGSVSLIILNVTSYIQDFNPAGDFITLTTKVNNPPSDLSVNGVTYTLGTIFKDSKAIINDTTGSVTCSQGAEHVYTCKIPLSIAGYDHNFAYFVRGNKISFSVTFSNVGSTIKKEIDSGFADITIPSFSCGDFTCNSNSGETTNNCCVDCGCDTGGKYCDVNRQSCGTLSGIDLNVLSVTPTKIDDCMPDTPHTVNITLQVANAPSDLRLDSLLYFQGSDLKNYPFTCKKTNPGSNSGLFGCSLTLPALEACQKQANPYVLGPNFINFTVSFSDGKKSTITKTFRKNFADISIQPISKCGNNICEGYLKESSANCCIDCPCSDEAFCNVPKKGDPGVCIDESSVKLIIDSPTSEIRFDSCEVPQEVKVLAHIENEPSNIIGSTFSAILNGSNAEFGSCKRTLAGLGQASNQIECTIKIRSLTKCSIENPVNRFVDNSIAMTMAVRSGLTGTEVLTINASLPEIVITQQIRSIFDITQAAFADMMRETKRTKEIVDKLIEKMEECLDVAIVLAIVSIALVIAGGIAGAKSEKSSWGEGVRNGAQAGQGLMGMWNTYCNLLRAYMDVQLKAQEIKIQFRQAQFCMDIIQHELDKGQEGMCGNGQELSCHQQLVSCLNFADINAAMDRLQQSSSRVTQISQQFGRDAENLGAGIGGGFIDPFTGGGGSADRLYLSYNGKKMINGKEVCNRNAKLIPTTWLGTRGGTLCPDGTNRDYINVQVISGNNCRFPVVADVSGLTPNIKCRGSQCNNYNMYIDGVQSEETWQIKLFCFRDSEQFSRNPGLGNSTSGALPVRILVDTEGKCTCWDNIDPGGTVKKPSSTTNKAPTAKAGPDKSVSVGGKIELDGSASSDPEDCSSGDPKGECLKYSWSETELGTFAKFNPTIEIPNNSALLGKKFTFSLVVTDKQGKKSSADEMILTVK